MKPQILRRGWGVVIYIYSLEFLCKEDLPLPSLSFTNLFNHFCILAWAHGYLFHSLGYNLMLPLFCCSNYSSFDHVSFLTQEKYTPFFVFIYYLAVFTYPCIQEIASKEIFVG